MYYQVFRGTDGNWYWHLKGGNHEIIAHGEGYTTKQGALIAIGLVKSSKDAPVYDA